MGLAFYSSLFLLLQVTFAIDLCEQHESCRDCIRDVNQCVWCDTHKLSGAKCKSKKENLEDWCPNKIINPKSTYNFTKNKEFSSETGKVIQIKPQQIKINVRPGDSVDFKFSFKTVLKYPVDLYFLMDASTALINKTAIVMQGGEIYRTIKNMTDNVHLGVGYFVDKNVLPFTNNFNNPNSYSFRNKLKLVDNPEAFKKAIDDMEFGFSYDEPEGGFDALSQILVCKSLIGWRKESRKIIILLTGSSMHVAGDGKAAGITKPYDGKCYTTDEIYQNELEMDYPSVGHINKLASEDEVTIIFAVHESIKYHRFYDAIIPSIRGSKLVDYPGDGIVQILKSVYEDITKTFKLKVNMKPEYNKYLIISFNPECYHSYNGYVDCGVKPNTEKEFNATLKLLSLPETNSIKVDLNIEGITEKLEIDVGVIKQCDCVTENNSKSCNHRGSLVCGACECQKDRFYGDSCQCAIVNSDSNPEDMISCTANDTICNNRGSCSCGMCNCRYGYKGKFCECSDNSCNRGANNELCSGPNNGDCDCGKCRCKSGWKGEICDCSTLNTKCISDLGKSLCSNRGKCNCGRCECDSISHWDVRTKEQPDCSLSCPEKEEGRRKQDGSCLSRQCLNIAPIVLCYLSSNNCNHSETINITVLSNLTLLQFNSSQSNWNHCSKVIVEVGCYTEFLFRYLSDSYGIEVIMEKVIDCVEANFLWGGICFATLIVIGVGTLIAWKIWTDRIDRLEYEQLYQQIVKDPIINDIFVQPMKTYNNPQYQQCSKQTEHTNKNKNC